MFYRGNKMITQLAAGEAVSTRLLATTGTRSRITPRWRGLVCHLRRKEPGQRLPDYQGLPEPVMAWIWIGRRHRPLATGRRWPPI